jgi:GNAT superfamily N-acetyltransferase
MPVIKTKTTYLQMFSPPVVEIAAPRDDVEISKVASPKVEFYRRLYHEVGSTFHWVDRLVMQDEELLAIIHHDLIDVLVLTAADEPLGYAELDRRQAGEIELAYFGLFPSATGQGLGKYLLNRAMRTAWAHRPQRVWVHTCDLDHPAALPNYLKAGFEVYDEVDIDQFVPEPGENGR